MCFCPSLTGRASVKKQHSLTLAPVLTPPAKRIQSLTPVQTPRPLPIKTKMQSPHPAKAQQVSVGVVASHCAGQVASWEKGMF